MASTSERNWAVVSTILTNITLNGTTEILSSVIDFVTIGYEGAHFTIDATFNSSGAAGITANLYGSIDAANFDDVPLTALQITVSTAAPQQVSFIIRDIAYGRWGLVHSSAETNMAVATIQYKPWTWKT